MTTLPYKEMGVRVGTHGAGPITVTSFSVPAGSLGFRRRRLTQAGIPFTDGNSAFNLLSSGILRCAGVALVCFHGGATLTPVAAQAADSTARTAAVPQLTFSGDVGFRGEFIGNENFAATDAVRPDDHRFRLRGRLRLGGELRPGEGWTVGFRMSSGDNAFPSSGWSSFSTDFRRGRIEIDRLFLRWQRGERVQLRVGIDANPLFAPTELLWDRDVQTAGATEGVCFGRVCLTAGQFMLREVRSTKPANEASSFLLAEGVTLVEPLGAWKLTLGASHYHYTDPDAIARALQAGELDAEFKTNRFDPAGRTIPAPGNPATALPADYLSGFSLLDLGLRLEGASGKFVLVGEAVVNLGAHSDAGLGAAYGGRRNLGLGGMARWGKIERPGDWSVAAGFFHVEADAVLAMYTSDDLQQTNVNSIPLEAVVRLPGHVDLTWDTYLQKKIDPALASNGGVLHPENALKVRSRITVSRRF